MMRKLFGSVLSLLVLASCQSGFFLGDPTWDTTAPKDTLRVLAIGNSFSANSVEKYLFELLAAEGVLPVIGNASITSCSLEKHAALLETARNAYRYKLITRRKNKTLTGVSLPDILADQSWDVVVFQQVSDLSGFYETIQPYLADLVREVSPYLKESCAFAFNMTWAYAENASSPAFEYYGRSQQAMYGRIVHAGQELLEDFPSFTLIPSGTAVQNLRMTRIGDTVNSDGHHLEETFGRFVAACTWCETLTGHSAKDNPFSPPDIDPDVADLCRAAAHAAHEHPFETWE